MNLQEYLQDEERQFRAIRIVRVPEEFDDGRDSGETRESVHKRLEAYEGQALEPPPSLLDALRQCWTLQYYEIQRRKRAKIKDEVTQVKSRFRSAQYIVESARKIANRHL